MRKPASLEKDIVVSIIVLIIVTLYLSIVNYSNHSQGTVVGAKQIESPVQVLNSNRAEQIYLFNTEAQAKNAFANFSADVEWDKNSVVGYVAQPMPNPGYTVKLLQAKREANYLNIKYQVNEPVSQSPTLTVIAYPTLFVSIPKSDLIAGSDLFIQFIEESTGHTKTLRLKPNEI